MVRLDSDELVRSSVDESRRLLEALVVGDFALPGQMVQSRADQVRNNAGGFVFLVDDLARVRRFLILGTDSGTYYVKEQDLTVQNVQALIDVIRKGKGGMLLREIVDISLAGRAPKQEPLLFALALCARYKVKDRKVSSNLAVPAANPTDEKTAEEKYENSAEFGAENGQQFDEYLHQLQQTAFRAVHKVARIPTHLFAFVKYCEQLAKETTVEGKQTTGWGRAMRKCVAEWYLQRSPKELALQMTKYRSRFGYSHRDLLRLAHPMASQNNAENKSGGRRPFWPNENTLVYDQLFKFACSGAFDAEKGNMPSSAAAGDGGEMPSLPLLKKARCDYTLDTQMVQTAAESDALKFIEAVVEASKLNADEGGEQRCVELIKQFGLVREHVPTALLNSARVWAELLEHMPMTALIRNLSKLSSVGLIDGQKPENQKYVDLVVSKILDQSAVHRARIHPISVLLAASVYEQGHGLKGSLEWKINESVKNALDECFTIAFHNVEPTKRRFCLALDVSGSMGSPITGGVLSCRTASAAMASVILRTEENVECVAFQDKLTVLPFSRKSTVTEMVTFISDLDFGSTDCALPMLWAAEQQRPFDVFVVFTDSETWAGKVKPFEALVNYRKKMDIPNAKLVVMGMASTEFTIADPNDPGMLDIVGLDSAVPELLRSFVLDEI